jgi:hypothetical protein
MWVCVGMAGLGGGGLGGVRDCRGGLSLNGVRLISRQLRVRSLFYVYYYCGGPFLTSHLE